MHSRLTRLASGVGLLLAAVLHAATFENFIPSSTASYTVDWSDAGAWTLTGGSDGDGIPDADDTVSLNSQAWPYGFSINCTAGWAADTINIVADNGNYCRLNVNNSGTVNAVNYNHTTANGYSWIITTAGSQTLTLTDFVESGTYTPRSHWPNNSSTWAFVGDATVQYSTTLGQVVDSANLWAGMLDFQGASGVTLQRNPNSSALVQEDIGTVAGNSTAPITVGRADNGTQIWTVGAGSHPALKPGGSSQDAGIRKVGSGDVQMADVDIVFDLAVAHTADEGDALSANGVLRGPRYDGTVSANSLTALAPPAGTKTARGVDILGRLLLDGEGGQQAGGTANGRAVSVVANDADTQLRTGTGTSSVYAGTIAIATGGGTFHLDSTGAGKVKFNINNDSRDRHVDQAVPALIAQGVYLGAQTYISDRNAWSDAGSPGTAEDDAGGVIEFRSNFVNASTENALWRTDHTTLYYAGPAAWNPTFEALSADNGLAGPGSDNFLIDRLVIGQDSASTTMESWLELVDAFDNAPGAGGEALYINTLEMYGGSLLKPKGLNVYVNNTGDWVRLVPGEAFMDGFIVPEPASVVLVALAGWLVLGGRRRRRIAAVVAVVAVLGAGQSWAAPPIASGLYAQYDATALTGLTDGDPVTPWLDSNGTANRDMVLRADTAPTYTAAAINGRPAVTFSASAPTTELSTRNNAPGALDSLTIIALVSARSSGGYIVGQENYGGSATPDFVLELSSGAPRFYNEGSSGIGDPALGSTIAGEGFVRIAATYDFATGATALYQNNVLADTGSAGSGLANSKVIGLGHMPYWWGGDKGMHSDIDLAEVLIYDRVLDATELGTIDNWLTSKYGIPEPSTALLLGAFGLLSVRHRQGGNLGSDPRE